MKAKVVKVIIIFFILLKISFIFLVDVGVFKVLLSHLNTLHMILNIPW